HCSGVTMSGFAGLIGALLMSFVPPLHLVSGAGPRFSTPETAERGSRLQGCHPLRGVAAAVEGPEPGGGGHGRVARADPELAVHALDVRADGLAREHELLGHP